MDETRRSDLLDLLEDFGELDLARQELNNILYSVPEDEPFDPCELDQKLDDFIESLIAPDNMVKRLSEFLCE